MSFQAKHCKINTNGKSQHQFLSLKSWKFYINVIKLHNLKLKVTVEETYTQKKKKIHNDCSMWTENFVTQDIKLQVLRW